MGGGATSKRSGASITLPPVQPAIVDELTDLDLGTIERRLGPGAFKRGSAYARGNRVVSATWDADTDTLSGSVIGHGALYRTIATFVPTGDGTLALEEGTCSCPVGFNCKHVAAIVIVATQGSGARRGGKPARSAPAALRPAGPAPVLEIGGGATAWEAPLRALIEASTIAPIGRPLAIELTVSAVAGRAPRLLARLMRPGARGGWVNGGLNWGTLEPWLREGYRPDHVELAGELHLAQRSGQRFGSYFVSAEKALDLGAGGARVFALLEEATKMGLVLLDGQHELPDVLAGEVVLDVAVGAQGARVVPQLRTDVSELSPLLFVGAEGLVCTHGTERRLRLVRLARPVPESLQRMLLGGRRFEIPAEARGRFERLHAPALRNVAPVVSSDGSYAPPAISAPELVLRADYRPGHALELSWRWAYVVGDDKHQVALAIDQHGPGYRDLAAERTLLAGLDLSGTGLEHLGLLDRAGRPMDSPAATAQGIDCAELTTTQLPRLAEHDGLTVEITGERADYRDVADTLTIGVSTSDVAGERDWFDLGVTIAVDGRELAFADVFSALARGETRMLLDDGAHFSLQAPKLRALRELIEEARALSDAPSGGLRISRYQAGLWADLAGLGVITRQAEAWQRQVGTLLDLETLPDHDPPAGLQARMRPYQLDGFRWLATLWELGLGGILADDMGLGKTLQALALILHAHERDPSTGPFLVVAPTSVVPNWSAEAARFAPGLAVEAVTDTLARSRRSIAEIAQADVVVTTYTLLRMDADAYGTVPWAGLLLDEAQFVKNAQAKTYRCVRELDVPFKLAITGTPMENNLMELWAMLSITSPGLFGDRAGFVERFARPIERGRDAQQLARLRSRIKPLVKRRTKELVARDLPAKQEQLVQVDLHPRHRKLYDTRLQRERQKILGLLEEDFDRNRFTILRSLTLLRQLSLHADLVEDGAQTMPCAKLTALSEQLEEVVGGGHRALVFSQFTGFLSKVRERLDRDAIHYCYLDGRTRRRQQEIDRFKAGDASVFLISLKAGGFGLNLTEADYCFLLDPWWNPATEAQAIDRTHRIGQERPVMVYRLIARDTIEEKVVALARRKAELFRGVMDEGELFAGRLTAQDIRGLLA